MNATDNMKDTARPVEEENKHKHIWNMEGKPGLYDTIYKCAICKLRYAQSVDNPDSILPVHGCKDLTMRLATAKKGEVVPVTMEEMEQLNKSAILPKFEPAVSVAVIHDMIARYEKGLEVLLANKNYSEAAKYSAVIQALQQLA